MSTRTPIELILYERQDCCLCHDMLAVLERLQGEFALAIRRVDVATSRELEERYGAEVPVLFVQGRKAFKYRVAEAELRRRLQREVRTSA